MLQNILNLEGVAVLSKEQQKSIKGGGLNFGLSNPKPGAGGGTVGSYCKMTISFPNGSSEVGGGYFTGSSYNGVSQAAAQECAGAIATMGASKCTYDCAYDGYGQ